VVVVDGGGGGTVVAVAGVRRGVTVGGVVGWVGVPLDVVVVMFECVDRT
jgi:hypothetical protein